MLLKPKLSPQEEISLLKDQISLLQNSITETRDDIYSRINFKEMQARANLHQKLDSLINSIRIDPIHHSSTSFPDGTVRMGIFLRLDGVVRRVDIPFPPDFFNVAAPQILKSLKSYLFKLKPL